MTKTLRDDKGQYAGSIGNGKTNTPQPQGFIARRRAKQEEVKQQDALETATRDHVEGIRRNVADYVLQKSETSDNVKLPAGMGTFLYTRLYTQLKQKGYKVTDIEMHSAYSTGDGNGKPYNDQQIKLLKDLYYSISEENPTIDMNKAMPGGAWYLRGVTFERDGRTITAEMGKDYNPDAPEPEQ